MSHFYSLSMRIYKIFDSLLGHHLLWAPGSQIQVINGIRLGILKDVLPKDSSHMVPFFLWYPLVAGKSTIENHDQWEFQDPKMEVR